MSIEITWAACAGDYVGTVKGHPEVAAMASEYAWVVYLAEDGEAVPRDPDGMPYGTKHAQQVILAQHIERWLRRNRQSRVKPLVYAQDCAERCIRRLLEPE